MPLLSKQSNWRINISGGHNMSVQINEIIIRAIITSDERNTFLKKEIPGKKEEDNDQVKIQVLELIDEALNAKKER